MKQTLKLTALTLALSLAVAAQAQMQPDQDYPGGMSDEQMSPSTSQTTFGDDETLASYQIKVEDVSYLSTFPPAVIYSPNGRDVSFQVINNTGRAIYFVSEGMREYIPISSQTTVVLRGVTSNPKYSIVDAGDNVLVSGTVVGNTQNIASAGGASSTSAQDLAWQQQTLSRFTSDSYVTEYVPEPDPEPVYHRPVAQRQLQPEQVQSVRGYW